jgi:hypothetical protein
LIRNKEIFFVFLIGVTIAMIGSACADQPVTADPEIQGLTTATSVIATGFSSESDSLAWSSSNLALDSRLQAPGGSIISTDGGAMLIMHNIPVFDDILGSGNPGEVQYTVGYSEVTQASQGEVTYLKSTGIDTGNKVVGQDNLQASKQVTFRGLDGGHVDSSETILVDGAGSVGNTSTKLLCPFAVETSSYVPEYCNILRVGSNVDMTTVSYTTSASEQHISATADIPVAAGYAMNLGGIGSTAASGDASVETSAHIQESGLVRYIGTFSFYPFGTVDAYRTGKQEDLQYHETTTVSGSIDRFAKAVSYESGMRLT